MKIQKSRFPALSNRPILTKPVSYTRLRTGDYVIVFPEHPSVRRFVRLDLKDGYTRLVVVDEDEYVQVLPFTKLVGRLSSKNAEGAEMDPNPKSFLERLVFRLSHHLSQPVV